MPSSILNLKFKGNKSFVAFSNLGDTESLTKTWKVCSKVASYLEQGQRLENLSWRLWHLQNIMVESDNAKSKREFKKLSKTMGDKLDKEKGRAIEELQAPGFKRNPAAEKLRQRAEEKERSRIESAAAADEGRPLKRMQFTFAVDHPAGTHLEAAGPVSVKKPDLKPSSAFRDTVIRRMRPTTRAAAAGKGDSYGSNAGAGAAALAGVEEADLPSLTEYGRKRTPPSHHSDAMNVEDPSLFNDASSSSSTAYSQAQNDMLHHTNNTTSAMNYAQTVADVASSWDSAALRFPSLFSTDFGPTALLFPQPSLTTALSYGEDVNSSSTAAEDGFRIARPTIELPLDEILNDVDPGHNARAAAAYAQMQARLALNMARAESPDGWSSSVTGSASEDVDMKAAAADGLGVPPMSQAAREALPATIHPSQVNGGSSGNMHVSSSNGGSGSGMRAAATASAAVSVSAPVTRGSVNAKPTLSVRTSTGGSERNPGATASGAGSIVGSGSAGRATQAQSTAPGGVKAECSNCGATHTPLWRRGLNDELNCNACGLYCKLHKRPRPKSMRSQHGEGRHQSAPRADSNEAMGEPAQCYNCHTVATPLWRKDDEGKTVCNACGLYFKLHGSARPISMKSDIIRKRSRHDARRVGSGETPSASPGASRRASPVDGVPGQGQGVSQQQQQAQQAQYQDQGGSSVTDSPTMGADAVGGGGGSLSFGFGDDYDFANPTPQSELMGALGTDPQDSGVYSAGGAFDAALVYSTAFPGPYHPDYLQKTFGLYGAEDAGSGVAGAGAGGSSGGSAGVGHDAGANDGANAHDEDRANKRRRMSVDSASEPPSSAASSFFATDGSSATTTSARSSLDFASAYPSYSPYNTSGTIRNNVAGGASSGGGGGVGGANGSSHTAGAGAGFWHPPLLPQDEAAMKSPHAFGALHPPMLPSGGAGSGAGGAAGSVSGTGADFPMDFLHPPLLPQEEHELFARYLHPPMVLGEDSPMPSLHPPLLPPGDAYYTQAQAQQQQAQVQAAAASARVHEAHKQHVHQQQHQQHQQQHQAQGDYYEQNFGAFGNAHRGFAGVWTKEF